MTSLEEIKGLIAQVRANMPSAGLGHPVCDDISDAEALVYGGPTKRPYPDGEIGLQMVMACLRAYLPISRW